MGSGRPRKYAPPPPPPPPPPPDILAKMGSVILRSNEGDEDGVCWGLSKDGRFLTKSVYNLIKSQLNLP